MVTHFWGRCSNRIESPFGSLVTMLFGFSFLLQSVAVSADAIPYPATVTYGGFVPTSGIIQWGFDSQDAVCLWKMTSIYGVSYSHYSDDPTIPYTRGSCWYYYPSLNTNVEYPNAWHRAATCPQGGDVYNFEIAMCKCLPGEDFAPELYPARMCKPSAGCAVDPIPPYTPDPHPALIDELSPRMQTALACLQAAIRGQGGSSIFKSGYRPAAYNAHLQAVFDQRTKLKDKGSECAARKAELAIEEQRHDIGTKDQAITPCIVFVRRSTLNHLYLWILPMGLPSFAMRLPHTRSLTGITLSTPDNLAYIRIADIRIAYL